jgi:hypothetical protein
MIFSKGSKLHIVTEGVKYTYLINSASLTQSVREASYSKNTIHEPNLIDESFIDTKSPVNISIDMYLGRDELFLFEWMGLTPHYIGNNVTKYLIHHGGLDVSTSPDIYLESSETFYKVTSSVIASCSFTIGPRSVTSVSISGQGSRLDMVSSIPSRQTTVLQSSSTFYSSAITVGGLTNLLAATMEYTRDVTWLGRKSVHDIGNIVYPFNPKVTRFAIAGSLTIYTDRSSPTLLEGEGTINIKDSEYEFNFDRCMLSYRLDTKADVHKTVIDYKLLPNTNSYINII